MEYFQCIYQWIGSRPIATFYIQGRFGSGSGILNRSPSLLWRAACDRTRYSHPAGPPRKSGRKLPGIIGISINLWIEKKSLLGIGKRYRLRFQIQEKQRFRPTPQRRRNFYFSSWPGEQSYMKVESNIWYTKPELTQAYYFSCLFWLLMNSLA